MRTKNDKLAVCHKDFGRLVGIDSSEEGVNGIGHCGYILLTLFLVEEEELPVAVAQFVGGGDARAILEQLVGQRVVRGWDPACHVIVYWLADFLLQPLKLFNLLKEEAGVS